MVGKEKKKGKKKCFMGISPFSTTKRSFFAKWFKKQL